MLDRHDVLLRQSGCRGDARRNPIRGADHHPRRGFDGRHHSRRLPDRVRTDRGSTEAAAPDGIGPRAPRPRQATAIETGREILNRCRIVCLRIGGKPGYGNRAGEGSY